jgi:hypothetical protein
MNNIKNICKTIDASFVGLIWIDPKAQTQSHEFEQLLKDIDYLMDGLVGETINTETDQCQIYFTQSFGESFFFSTLPKDTIGKKFEQLGKVIPKAQVGRNKIMVLGNINAVRNDLQKFLAGYQIIS